MGSRATGTGASPELPSGTCWHHLLARVAERARECLRGDTEVSALTWGCGACPGFPGAAEAARRAALAAMTCGELSSDCGPCVIFSSQSGHTLGPPVLPASPARPCLQRPDAGDAACPGRCAVARRAVNPVVVGPSPHSCSSPDDCVLGLCVFYRERERTHKCGFVRCRRESRKATQSARRLLGSLAHPAPVAARRSALSLRLRVCFWALSVPLGYVLMTLSLLLPPSSAVSLDS